jgi:hypothetical protein
VHGLFRVHFKLCTIFLMNKFNKTSTKIIFIIFRRQFLKNIHEKLCARFVRTTFVVFIRDIHMKIQILNPNLGFRFERFGCCQVWQFDSDLLMYFFQKSSIKYGSPVKESLTANFHVLFKKTTIRKTRNGVLINLTQLLIIIINQNSKLKDHQNRI